MSPMPRRRFALLGALCLALAACAGPVSTTRVDPKVVLRDLGRSAITTGEPSIPTRNVLFERGLFEAYSEHPEAALAELHRAMVASRGDQNLLFALAELSFLRGQAAAKPDYYLAAAVYAHAFLFPENTGGAAPERFDPRLRSAADLYNCEHRPLDGDVQPVAGRPRHPEPVSVLVLPVRFRQADRAVLPPAARRAGRGHGAARPRG